MRFADEIEKGPVRGNGLGVFGNKYVRAAILASVGGMIAYGFAERAIEPSDCDLSFEFLNAAYNYGVDMRNELIKGGIALSGSVLSLIMGRKL